MPPGGDKVGEVHVDIHVNAGPGEAELAAFRAKVDRDFEELDRKKAEATLGLKSADFDKKIDEAKGKLDYFKSRRAAATLDLAKKHFDEQITAAEAELKALGKQKATIQVDSKQLRAANAEQRLMSKARALDERAALRQTKVERSLTNERRRASLETTKQRAELAKLSDQYERLRGKQQSLEKSSRRVFSAGSITQVEKEARKLERVASEADHVKNKIEQLGGSVAHLDPQFARNSSMLDRWLSKLGDTSIRIGPLTTSIKGLGLGLGLLGPLIFELGGGVASLVGTIGEGLAGASAVGIGALGGLATSALGVGLVIKPLIGEFKEVHTAAEALTKAELKYGKGSEQVKTAQERLNNELKGVSPIAREAFEDYGNLGSQWKKLTEGARPAVFNAFGQSLKTVQALLPGFARESTKTTQVASKAWSSWMKSLRSNEAKALLGQLMGDFRASMPGLAAGLSSLAAMLGRIGAAGAHFLPGLSHGFADWANNLEHAVGGGQKLQTGVGRLVNQMQDFGHLTQDTGSFIVHFFDASANAGDGLVDSLDKVISRWDRWTQTAGGKASLSNFFDESQTATEDFMSSISHLTELLFQFSRATAPVANGLLKVVTFIGNIVSAADNLVGVKQLFQGIGVVLASLFVASKVLAFSDAIAGVLARMGLLAAVETEAATATAAQAAASGAAAAALEAQAVAAAEADVAMGAGLAEGAAGAGVAMEGAAGSAGILSAALAPEVLIPAAALGGLVLLASSTADIETAWESAAAKFKATSHVIPQALHEAGAITNEFVEAQHRNVAATDAVASARQRLLKLQRENAPASKQTAAVEALTTAENKQAAQTRATGVSNRKQIETQKELVKGARARVQAAEEEIKTFDEQAHHTGGKFSAHKGTEDLEEAKQLAKAERDLAAAKKEVAEAQRRETVSAIPYERSIKGLAPISKAAEQGLHRLSQTIGATATKKIGSFVNPKDVAKVTDLSNRLTKLGRGGQVKNIAVKSQGADQTISKLRTLQKATNKVEGARASIKIGANDSQAQSRLKRVAALSQRVTGSKNTIRILANSSSAEQAINRLSSHLKAVALHKYQARIDAIDNTQGASSAAKTKLKEAAGKKYTARIDAVDNASSKAKKAEGAGKSAAKPYKLSITATNAQALSAISAVQSGLSSLQDKTVNVNVVTHKSGGFSGGQAAGYYTPFAAGGLNDRELQRANEKAVVKQSGPSQRVSKPTMLVGEQAPQHHEYVIATNPAYRNQNKRYLGQAADDLGYEVIPAFKKGKGKASSGGGASTTASAGPAPYKKQSKRHWKVHNHTFAPGSVEDLNTAEGTLSNLEGKFNAELDREEQEIAHKKRTAWDFSAFKGLLNQEAGIQNKIIHNFIPHIVEASTQARDKADRELKGPLSKGKVSAARKEANAVEREYSGLKSPTKKKGESDKDYANKKASYDRHKNALKRNSKEAKAYADRLEKERGDAIELREKAAEELKEVRHEVLVEHETALFEINTEQEKYTDIEQNPELAPYYETAEGAGSGAPTIGEQTASLNEARAGLYEQFASNVTAGGGPAAGTTGIAGLVGGAGGGSAAPGGSFSTMAAHAAAMGATDHLTKQLFGGGPRAAGGHNAPSTGSAADGKVVNVTNNFAAPPPDPHTWSRQQEFELGALA